MSAKKPAKSKHSPYRIYLDVFCDACGHASAIGEKAGVALCDACFPRVSDEAAAKIAAEMSGGA